MNIMILYHFQPFNHYLSLYYIYSFPFLIFRMEEKCRWSNMTRLILEGCPLLLLKKATQRFRIKKLENRFEAWKWMWIQRTRYFSKINKNEILNQHSWIKHCEAGSENGVWSTICVLLFTRFKEFTSIVFKYRSSESRDWI